MEKLNAKQTFEQKAYEAKVKAKRVANEVYWWIKENPQTDLMALTSMVGITKGVTKVTSKVISAHQTNKEIRFKERTIYDRSLGRYVELKHKLSPAEALTIEERRANGEKLHVILNDMGLLKK